MFSFHFLKNLFRNQIAEQQREKTASIFHLDRLYIFIWSFPDDVTFAHIDYQQLQSQDSISCIIQPFLEFYVVHLTDKSVALWAQWGHSHATSQKQALHTVSCIYSLQKVKGCRAYRLKERGAQFSKTSL